MTPHTELIAELHLVLQRAEAAGASLRAEAAGASLRAARDRNALIQFGTLEDHRTEVIGEMLAAINRAEPELGTRLQAAMYPTVTTEDEEQVPA